MTIPDLRSLVMYHEARARDLSLAATQMKTATAADINAQARWHGHMAKQLSELADTFESAGRLLSNLNVK